MGIKQIFYSLWKSYKLAKLQRRIMSKKLGFLSNDDRAQEQYLDLCVSDVGVKTLMKEYKIAKGDLVNIRNDLERAGAGQWVKGHYVALSTLAYVEPLKFYIWSKEQKMSDLERVDHLVAYFAAPSGALSKMMSEV